MTSPVRLVASRPEGGAPVRRLLRRLVSRENRGHRADVSAPTARPGRGWDAYDVYFMALGRRR